MEGHGRCVVGAGRMLITTSVSTRDSDLRSNEGDVSETAGNITVEARLADSYSVSCERGRGGSALLGWILVLC